MAEKYVKLDDIIDTLEHEWGYEGMREDLYNLPTADVVEMKHGEWKPIDPESDVRFFCSECETEISTSWDYDEAEMWKYCPCCGAKMDGTPKERGGEK